MHDVTKRLLERLTPLLATSRGVVILERVARGGGRTRWFFCRTPSEVEIVLPQLQPGSRVGFFFDDRIRRVLFSASVRQAVSEIATTTGEVVFGHGRAAGQELDVHLLDPSEIAEHLAVVPDGEIVYYGVFPAIEDHGLAIAFTPPDADGVVRPQPT